MASDPNIKFTLSPEDLTKLGLKGAGMIVERTQKGIGANGNPFTPYSELPFAMPFGGITLRARKNLGDKLKVFKTKLGKLWAVIEGGYAAFKAAAYPQDGSVNLTATGRMLNALTVIATDPANNSTILGFTNGEEALKAWYQNEAGAGKSRTIRKFLGFTDQEKGELAAWAATRIIIKV